MKSRTYREFSTHARGRTTKQRGVIGDGECDDDDEREEGVEVSGSQSKFRAARSIFPRSLGSPSKLTTRDSTTM